MIMNRLISKLQQERDIFFIILSGKVAVFLIIFLAFSLLPTSVGGHFANFLYPSDAPITLESAYATWDAQHFLYLSENGYRAGHISNQFSPLLPFFIYLFRFIFQNSFIAGMIVSNVASLFAFYLFYKLVFSLYNKEIALLSLFFLIAFPFSFFYSLIYTESVFLLLVILYFTFLFKKNYFLVSVIGFFIPLVRPVGLLILLPALYFYLFKDNKLHLRLPTIVFIKVLLKRNFFLLLSPIVGLLFYFGYMYYTTGNPFEPFYASRYSVINVSLLYIFQPAVLLRITFQTPLALHGINNSIIDRVFFLLFLLSLSPMYKRVHTSLFLYAVSTGIFFVLMGMYMSYLRHLIVVFPLFIFLALLIKEKKYAFLKFPILYTMVLLQSFFLILHALNYWVA